MVAEFGLQPMLENLVVEVVEILVVEVAQKHHHDQEILVVAVAQWNPYASVVSWDHGINAPFQVSFEMGSWKSCETSFLNFLALMPVSLKKGSCL
jgi:hypothetical protein